MVDRIREATSESRRTGTEVEAPIPVKDSAARAFIRQSETDGDFIPVFKDGIQIAEPTAHPLSPPTLVNPFTAATPVVMGNGPNIVLDHSFESGVAGWVAGTNTAITQSSTLARTGTYSLRLAASASGTISATSTTYPVIPGVQYIASVYAQPGSTARASKITVTFYDNTLTATGTPVTATGTPPTSGWTILVSSPSFTIPDDGAYVSIKFETTDSCSSGEYHYLDDVNLYAISNTSGDITVLGSGNLKSANYESGSSGWAIDGQGNSEFNNLTLRGRFLTGQATLSEGTSILPNGLFETDASGWTGTNCTLSRDTGTKRTGTASMKMTVTTTPTAMSADTPTGTSGIPVINGGGYLFRFWAKAVTADPAQILTVKIRWYNSSGTYLGTTYDNYGYSGALLTGYWRYASAFGVAPADGYAAVTLSVGATTVGNVYVDDGAFIPTSSLISAGFATSGSGRRIEITDALIEMFNANGDSSQKIQGLQSYLAANGFTDVLSIHVGNDAGTNTASIYMKGQPSHGGPGDTPSIEITSGQLKSKGSHSFQGGGASAPIPAILDYKYYASGSDTSYTLSSTTVADVDSTNLKVVFGAPASGKVIIQANGFVDGSASNVTYFALRDGSSTVTNSIKRVYSASGGAAVFYEVIIDGLTPGTIYTWKWAYKVVTANAALYHGPNNGLLTMKAIGILD